MNFDRDKAENERWRVLHTNAIESNSKWLSNHATQVAHHVRQLSGLPEYELQAEEALDKAIAELSDALLKAKVARSDLQKKRRHKLRVVS